MDSVLRVDCHQCLTRTCAGLIALAASVCVGGRPSHAQSQTSAVGEDGTRLTPAWSGMTETIAYGDAEGAGGPKVAIVAAAAGDVNDPQFTDVRDKLLAAGQFSSVSTLHAGLTTPSLLQLMAFDAVLVWSNFDFADAIALGDHLADYVDNGRGVVTAVFGNTSSEPDRFLDGRWRTEGYDVITQQGGNANGPATLGTILQPAHALVAGVSTFSGGPLSARPATTSLQAGSTLVAEWSDGQPLVAFRGDFAGRRVDLGFYPPSSDVLFFYWDAATDGAALLANALVYAAGDLASDVEVRLLTLTGPSAVSTTTDLAALPGQLAAVACGGSFVLELWASDLGTLNTGILGLYVDLLFDPLLLNADALIHTAPFDAFFLSGSIDNVVGTVDNFGAFNFAPQGIAPTWVRLGYVSFSAVGAGPAGVFSSLGVGGIAVADRPPPPVQELELGSAALEVVTTSDLDLDCDVDLIDVASFQRCFGGLTVPPDCTTADIDLDGTVDLMDWSALAGFMTGP